MPVVRTCTLICDGCKATTLGHLEGDDVAHPEGWVFTTNTGSPTAVFCPTCTGLPGEHVVAAEAEVEELRQLVGKLVEWVDSPQVQGAFTNAWIHGGRVAKEFSIAAGALWAQARAIKNKNKKAEP